MLPCAGWPNATGVAPLVAANIRPRDMVNAVPVPVRSSAPDADADGGGEGPDEHAATVVNTAAATGQLALHTRRLA
jgi:hypothetical protein